MKIRSFAFLCLVICAGAACKKNPDPLVKTGIFFRQLSPAYSAADMVTDASNNIYITGKTKIATSDLVYDFNTVKLTAKGGFDAYLLKYDQYGTILWAKILGGNKDDEPYAIAVDHSENVYMAGRFRDSTVLDGVVFKTKKFTAANDYDMFLAKYDKNGKQLWARAIPGEGMETPTAIVIDPTDTKVFITGTFYKSIYFAETAYKSASRTATFLASFTPDGQASWVKTYGNILADAGGSFYGTSLKRASDGGFILAGSFEGTNTIGALTITSNGDQDIFVSKLTDGGTPVWIKSFGGTSTDNCHGLAVDDADNIYIGGEFRNSMTLGNLALKSTVTNGDAFFVKYDIAGNLKWATQATGTVGEQLFDLKADKDKLIVSGMYGNTVILGDVSLSSPNTVFQGFTARYSAEGKCEQAENLGTSNGYATRIVKDNSGFTLLFGEFSKTFTFQGAIYPVGSHDVFLLKYK